VRRILDGYDGSDGGKRALERAIAEAHESRGRIIVLSVANMPLDLDVPRERLASAGLEANLSWTAGDPGRAILETAKEIRAQVIVLGEHHHGLLGNLLGADVDTEVQREAGCEVTLA
jgi:nucleotide-binding universal stress UspA family protein